MPSIERIIDKMKRQPNGIRIQEAEKVLNAHGYTFARQKGSHVHFRNGNGDIITIKRENPLKAVYVEDVLRRIGIR